MSLAMRTREEGATCDMGTGDESWPSRRALVYCVVGWSDTAKAEAIRQGLVNLVTEFRLDPQAIETLWVSVHTCETPARRVMPLTETPWLGVGNWGTDFANARDLGGALGAVLNCIDEEWRASTATRKGDWYPVVVVLLAGDPLDEWVEVSRALSKRARLVLLVPDGSLLAGQLKSAGTASEINAFGIRDAAVISFVALDPQLICRMIWRAFGIYDSDLFWGDSERADFAPLELPFTNPLVVSASTQSEGDEQMAEELEAGMRRLPVYMLLDCSGSMSGEPIEAVKQGVKYLLSELRGDPQALETVWLSVITFDSSARQVVPLTDLTKFKEPQINASGSTALGEALSLLSSSIDKEVRKTTPSQKGDWKPLIFLMTDGEPTDSWERPADNIKNRRPGNIIACGAGSGVNVNTLKRITETVVMMQNYSPDTFKAFFKWVSASVTTASQKVATKGDAPIDLPPPPPQIQIVP